MVPHRRGEGRGWCRGGIGRGSVKKEKVEMERVEERKGGEGKSVDWGGIVQF